MHNNEDWLRARHAEGKSQRDIARLAGVSTPTIRARLKKFNIEARTISDGMLQKSAELSSRSIALYSDPERRKQHSVTMVRVQSTRKEELSRSAKLNWTKNRAYIMAGKLAAITDEYRRNLSEASKLSWTPERRLKQSKIAKDLWTSIDYKVKRMVSLKLVTDTPEFSRKVSDNSIMRWRDSRYRELQAKARTTQPSNSILEDILCRLLSHRGIEARQVSHGPWSFDLGFTHNDIKYLVECQGSYWHSLPEVRIRDRQKLTYYERYLADTHKLFYIYEYEYYGVNKLNYIIDSWLDLHPTQIDFSYDSISVGLITREESNQFFWLHHYLGRSRAGLDIAVTLDSEVLACCRYTGITRLQTADRLGLGPDRVLELNRLCIHPNRHKRNFASWFLSRTINSVPESIDALVAFSDEGAGHTGSVYKAAGWTLDGRTKPSYWYTDRHGSRYHKKTIWDQARRLKLSEKDYANTMGLVRIEGKPVLRFIKWIR